MADVQQQFLEFHENIKLSDENELLREKRDIILEKLKRNLDDGYPPFTSFVQGSYAMSTGIKPLDGVYDIDVGIRFDISKDDYEDPVEPKIWVADALKGHTTKDPEIKHACVRVTYQQDGEEAFSIDLPIYAANNSDKKLYLARGKKYSSEEYRYWEVSDPQGLIDIVRSHFDDSRDRGQFRRVVRAMKRWAEIKFKNKGHGKPTGVALTVAALQWMKPSYDEDVFSRTRRYNDLEAVKTFVETMLDNFSLTFFDDEFASRLLVLSPVDPYDNLFKKMTNDQMGNFEEKLEALKESLVSAENSVDPVDACKILRGEFGDDFPIPPQKETAEKKSRAITTSSESAAVKPAWMKH